MLLPTIPQGSQEADGKIAVKPGFHKRSVAVCLIRFYPRDEDRVHFIREKSDVQQPARNDRQWTGNGSGKSALQPDPRHLMNDSVNQDKHHTGGDSGCRNYRHNPGSNSLPGSQERQVHKTRSLSLTPAQGPTGDPLHRRVIRYTGYTLPFPRGRQKELSVQVVFLVRLSDGHHFGNKH